MTDIKNCIWKIYKEKIGITKNKCKKIEGVRDEKNKSVSFNYGDG